MQNESLINIDRRLVVDKNLITYHEPKSPAAEAFRTLRTNIGYAGIDNELKMLVVTSPSPKDGKTTVSTNYAVSMAQTDKKVLIIDCDLRKPKLHRAFKISNDIGLTHILTDMVFENQPMESLAKKVPDVKNLHVITSGFVPPNPTEILTSQKMECFLNKAKEDFDVVVLDTPPVGSLTDAAILGKLSDGVILVIASGETNVDLAVRAKKALANVDAKILGVVLTKLDKGSSGYYYRYYNYDYYYGDEKDR